MFRARYFFLPENELFELDCYCDTTQGLLWPFVFEAVLIICDSNIEMESLMVLTAQRVSS